MKRHVFFSIFTLLSKAHSVKMFRLNATVPLVRAAALVARRSTVNPTACAAFAGVQVRCLMKGFTCQFACVCSALCSQCSAQLNPLRACCTLIQNRSVASIIDGKVAAAALGAAVQAKVEAIRATHPSFKPTLKIVQVGNRPRACIRLCACGYKLCAILPQS